MVRTTSMATWPLAAVALAAALLAGCGGGEGKAPRLQLAHARWQDGKALAYAAAVVAEDRLGYEVEVVQTGLEEGLRRTASGKSDAFFALWLPETNESQLATFGPDLVDLGPAFEGARAGLVATLDLPVDSISGVDRVSGAIGGRILAIEAQSGIGRETRAAVEAYGLSVAVEHLPTEELFEALERRFAAGEPAVFSGWQPHWMFARWRLKFLADPKGVFGDEERLHPVARAGLRERDPRAAALLEALHFDEAQFDSLLDALRLSRDGPEETARRWLSTEGPLVDGWVQAAQDAGESAP